MDGQHSSKEEGALRSANNKSMQVLPMPKGGWSSLEGRHTSSDTDLKQVEKLGKPLLFQAGRAGGASPGEADAEEDVAVAIDSPSKLFGGQGQG